MQALGIFTSSICGWPKGNISVELASGGTDCARLLEEKIQVRVQEERAKAEAEEQK